MKRLAFVIFLAMSTAAVATTYVRVEKDGTKTYSDRPIPGGTVVELEPAQTYSAPSPSTSVAGSVPLEQQLLREMDDFTYKSCTIVPKNDDTFTNPEVVTVGVVLDPQLRVGDVIDLKVDGAQVGGPTTTSYSISPVNRGTHMVTALVKDRYGRQLCNASASFHVFRPSLNSPARRN